MKKLILIAAYLLAAFMTGCSKSPSGDEPVIDPVEDVSYIGTMKVISGGEENVSENVNVSVSFNGDKTVDIMFHKVKFVPQMPMPLDVTVPGVKYEVGKDGVYAISADGIVPVALGVPYEKFRVSGLTGTFEEDDLSLALTFGQYPTSYSGSRVK